MNNAKEKLEKVNYKGHCVILNFIHYFDKANCFFFFERNFVIKKAIDFETPYRLVWFK